MARALERAAPFAPAAGPRCWRCSPRAAVRAARRVAVAQGRAAQRGQWTRFARGAERTRGPRHATLTDALPLFQRVSVTRRARRRAPVPARQPQLPRASRLRGADAAARSAGEPALLVDRGWVPFTGSRAQLPDVSLAAASRRHTHRPPRHAAEPRARERPRRRPTGSALAQGHELPGRGAARRRARHAARAAHPAARSRRARRLRCATGSRRACRRCGISPTRSSGGASRCSRSCYWGVASRRVVEHSRQ